jgi:hypothetical protein
MSGVGWPTLAASNCPVTQIYALAGLWFDVERREARRTSVRASNDQNRKAPAPASSAGRVC